MCRSVRARDCSTSWTSWHSCSRCRATAARSRKAFRAGGSRPPLAHRGVRVGPRCTGTRASRCAPRRSSSSAEPPRLADFRPAAARALAAARRSLAHARRAHGARRGRVTTCATGRFASSRRASTPIASGATTSCTSPRPGRSRRALRTGTISSTRWCGSCFLARRRPSTRSTRRSSRRAARRRRNIAVPRAMRSPLFDEGGVIVATDDSALTQLIVDFEWKELFWRRRAELESRARFFAFGHALYEKATRSLHRHGGEDDFRRTRRRYGRGRPPPRGALRRSAAIPLAQGDGAHAGARRPGLASGQCVGSLLRRCESTSGEERAPSVKCACEASQAIAVPPRVAQRKVGTPQGSVAGNARPP